MRHVALIVETSMAYGRGILAGVAKYMAAHEPWSIYVDQRGLSEPPPLWLNDWNGHGVIMRAQTKRIAQVVEDLGVPAVDTQHQVRGINAHAVIADHAAIAEAAANHLLERHFRSFAFVGVERALWSKLRRDAYVSFLRSHGYRCNVYSPISRRRFQESWDGGQQDLAEWLQELPKPLGVFAAHDLRGLCVLDACRRIGLLVPEQVAVIGVDNDEALCKLADPPLSSVKLDFEYIGYAAAAMLDGLMQKRKISKQPVAVKPLRVVTRRSTDVMAISDAVTAQALRYIYLHADDGLSVTDVASHCGVSRRLIERSFSQFLDSSPHEQIVRVRVARVKQLLLETDFSLDEIAARSGWSHAAYLSAMFKKEVGKTPGQFRLEASHLQSGSDKRNGRKHAPAS
jgi:LacI family transcriptional regulator